MAENRRMTVTRKTSIAHIGMQLDASRAQDDWLVTVQFEEAFYDEAGDLVPGTQRPTRAVTRRWREIKGDANITALHSMLRRKIYDWLAADASKPTVEDVLRKQAVDLGRLTREGTP